MNFPRLIAVLLLAGAAAASDAAERRYSIGLHDFAVPDVDSHTYGIDASVSVEKQTESGKHLVGSVDLFVDHDKDDLDPDHIPIWWKIHLGTDGTSGIPLRRMSAGRRTSTPDLLIRLSFSATR